MLISQLLLINFSNRIHIAPQKLYNNFFYYVQISQFQFFVSMNFSKNYNKTPSHNSSTQKDKSSLSPLRLKNTNTNTKTKQNTQSKMKDKQNKSYTNLLSFQNIKSFAKPHHNQKSSSFYRQHPNDNISSARSKLFIYHQKPSSKEKSYSLHDNTYSCSIQQSSQMTQHDRSAVNTTYNKIKQMKRNYQIQLKERDRSKITSPQIKYFKNKQISFNEDNINNSYENKQIQQNYEVGLKHLSPFKSSKHLQNMSNSKSTIQLLQSNSRNLSNQEISFQISQNYDLQNSNSNKESFRANHYPDYAVQHKNRDHQLIQALKLQNQSLKSTLGLYREQNECINSMNMNYKRQSKKASEQMKKVQNQMTEKNTKIQTLEGQLKQYTQIFSKLQDLEVMQEKMLKQNQKLKSKTKINQGILQNIANMVRMSGYYHGDSNSKDNNIINSIKSLTQIFFNKQKEEKSK